MKSINELYLYLDNKIPSFLSLDWDNDGLMVCPDKGAPCHRVLLSLDVTREVVSYAKKNNFSLIVSHHPLIFRPLKGVSDQKIITLIEAGISVFSFHTRLDRLDGGVNFALGKALGIKNAKALGEENICRIGDIDELSPADFAKNVKAALGSKSIRFVVGNRNIKRVAFAGGDGKDFLMDVINSGADAYVTGSISYNSMLDAYDAGITVIEAGHFETENPVLSVLCGLIHDFDSEIYTELYNSSPEEFL